MNKAGQIKKSREFLKDLRIIQKKYNMPLFAVTDGASICINNGNSAVKHARESHILWEESNNIDTDEEWKDE